MGSVVVSFTPVSAASASVSFTLRRALTKDDFPTPEAPGGSHRPWSEVWIDGLAGPALACAPPPRHEHNDP